MNICKNCKFFHDHLEWGWGHFYYCKHPTVDRRDPVTGEHMILCERINPKGECQLYKEELITTSDNCYILAAVVGAGTVIFAAFIGWILS